MIVAVSGICTACGTGSESTSNADSKVIGTTPPPTGDSTSTVGTMIGDTTLNVESNSTVGDTVK